MATRGKMEHQMEQQLDVVEKYYLDEINMINTRHTTRTNKLNGQMVVSCPVATIITVIPHVLITVLQYRTCISKSKLQKRALTN